MGKCRFYKKHGAKCMKEMAVGEWEDGALDECDNEVGVQV
jgi:hypothetical protein